MPRYVSVLLVFMLLFISACAQQPVPAKTAKVHDALQQREQGQTT